MRTTAVFIFMSLFTGIARAQSERPGMGALPYNDADGTGVMFRVWAPNAQHVNVAGTFNDWSLEQQAMTAEGTNGMWSCEVPAARVGAAYKYVIVNDGTHWRGDPYANVWDGSEHRNSVVTEPLPPPKPYARPALSAMVVYELHVGTFVTSGPTNADGTFDSAIGRLDYLADLGINAIQLMPIVETMNQLSWGYDPASMYAIKQSYGGIEGLRRFIEAAHDRGIAVIVDMVINHWGDVAGAGDCWRFDGWGYSSNSGGIYFYEDTRASTPWGPRPNYGRPEVRAYILGAVRAMLALGVDAFRWDAVSHVVAANGTAVPDGISLLEEAAALIHAAGAINIAENGAAACARGTFDAEWNYTLRDTMALRFGSSDTGISESVLATALAGGLTNHVTIACESHDTAGALNAWAERWPQACRYSGQELRARKLAYAGTALAFLGRGTPLMFQGQELYETNLWHDTMSTPWGRADVEAGCLAFHRDLISLKRNLRGVGNGATGSHLSTHPGNDVLAVTRRAATTNDPALVILGSFRATTNTVTRAYPASGPWYRALSTVDTRYGLEGGGSMVVVVSNGYGTVTLPPYALMVFSQRLDPSQDLDGDGSVNADELIAGTDPASSESVLKIIGLSVQVEQTLITWSGGGMNAHLEFATAVAGPWARISTSSGTSTLRDWHHNRGYYRIAVDP